ncbi:MAG: DUF465 domain-containing protein [Hyphomicrobiales bacterium]|nr:DUF465 domain-containing protein [Hyphomicrobiales bacterium]
MALQAHISELSEKHRLLNKQVEDEMARPSADETRIAMLKRQKLRLKDKIEKLTRSDNGA